MPNGLPVHKSPEKKVFGIIGETVSTDDGEVYTKQASDSRNIGWGEILDHLLSPTPTATPTVTPTSTRPFIVTQTVGTPTPTPTITPTKTATSTPTTTRVIVPSSTPTQTSTPTVTPTLTTSAVTPTPTATTTNTAAFPIPTPTPTAYQIGATIEWAIQSLVSQTFGDGYLVGDTLMPSYTITNQANATSFTIRVRSGIPDPYSGAWTILSGPSYTYIPPTLGYYQLGIVVNYNDGRSISVESSVITVASFDRPTANITPATVTRGNATQSNITISEGFAGLVYVTSWGTTGVYTVESSTERSWNTYVENNVDGYGIFYLNPFKRLSNGRVIYGTSVAVNVQKKTYYIGYTLDSSGYIRFSYEDADGVSHILEKTGAPLQTIYPDYDSPCASSVTLLTPGGAGRSVSLTTVGCS
jgi:hypothetical protein